MEQQVDGVTDACLDAETVAAWIDGGLSGAALEAAQLHVADCARCQDLVGALARVESTLAPVEAARRGSRRWLAWLVPLTAAAAAAAIWIAVPDRATVVPAPPKLEDRAARVQPSEAAAPAAAPPENRPQALQAPARKELAQPDRVASASKKDAAERATEGRVQAMAAPAAAARADAMAPAIVSPDPSVRWRIAGSVVERSTDGGSTWETASIGVAADLTAGAAPSASVCWLVGRAGVVLLTTDGRTWRQVAFPEMTDLSGVHATDASGREASVSTADGRTFSTTDGGATWVPRPLQEF